MLFTGNSSVAEVLRERPVVMGWLNASGLDVRGAGQKTCAEFCAETGLRCEEWLRFVEQLPVLADGFDPDTVTLHALADRLTADHRRFRNRDLAVLEKLVERLGHVSGGADLASEVAALFRTFKLAFLAHLRKEEERIFPYILGLEARVCAPQRDVQLHSVDLTAFSHRQGHGAEDRFEAMAAGMRHRLGVARGTASGIQERLARVLNIIEGRLVRHAALENDVFFRRAAILEQHLDGAACAAESIPP
jgi:iron-sulfur cluster repair protein YtfE (RIC family)